MKPHALIRAALLLSCAQLPFAALAEAPPHTEVEGEAAVAEDRIIEFPYIKFVLDNGLTLIVNEDHSAPVVSMATYYHVGSANEVPGRTGFAHLFEHLVFNGSENADDDWFKFMNELGATNMNGSTSFDRTNYFQTVPKSAFDQLLWYESDRMANLLPAIDEAKVDEQREVVKNEKRQRANSPLGGMDEILFGDIYPEGHPYSWTPIGSMEDLNAASLEDVKAFHQKWYGPGNTVIALSGDITAQEAREKIEQYFGNIAPSEPVSRPTRWIAKRSGEKRAMMEARVPEPQIVMAWNVPGMTDPDALLLDIAGDAFASGESSPLYKSLVRDRQLASSVSMGISMLELGSVVTVDATARPGVSEAQLEAALNEELGKFLEQGPDADTLERIKLAAYSNYLNAKVYTSTKASQLAEAELYAGTPAHVETEQRIIQGATTRTVRDAAVRWLSDGKYVLEIVPFGEPAASGVTVDRKAKPPVGEPGGFTLPPLQHATLSNGLKIALAERHDVPTVTMGIIFPFGFNPERTDETYGLGNAAAFGSLTTTNLSALELEERQKDLGASIGWQTTAETSWLSMSALKINLDQSLDLFADVLLRPGFSQDEIDRKVALFEESFKQSKSTPGGKLALVSDAMLFGEDHPYARNLTPEVLKRWSAEDYRAFYQKWVRPDGATVLVVGDTTLPEILPELEQRLGNWKASGAKPTPAPLPEPIRPERVRIVLIDQPAAESSLIGAGQANIARNDPDFEVREMVNTVLGGGFVSRLNMNLREDKGWSYGMRAAQSSAQLLGKVEVGGSVQTDKTAQALKEIDRELRELGTTRKPDAKEIEVARNAKLRGLEGALQGPRAAYSLYRDLYRYHLPEDYWNGYFDRIESITPSQIDAAAAGFVDPDTLTWFVVGDLSKIEDDIRALNLGEVMVYNADGERVR